MGDSPLQVWIYICKFALRKNKTESLTLEKTEGYEKAYITLDNAAARSDIGIAHIM